MTQLRAVEQTAFDEQVIEDEEIEAALDDRERKKHSFDAVKKIFDGAHEFAMAKISELELPEGGAARGGRVRINRTAVPAGHREFDKKASSRIRISVAGEE